MAYCQGPFAPIKGYVVAPTAIKTRAPLSSSRAIDPKTMKYVVADDGLGGFEAMDDIAQCVLLAISYIKSTGRIDPKEQNKRKQQIRDALAALTAPPEPYIRIDGITITDDGRQTEYVQLAYTNLRSNTQQTVTF